MILNFSLQLFHCKTLLVLMPRSSWENVDRFQYPFQPIIFVKLVIPSPCEIEQRDHHGKRVNSPYKSPY